MKIVKSNSIKKLILVIISSLTMVAINAQTQKGVDIDGEAPFDYSGQSVSMPDANTIAIGALLNDGKANNAGNARVYTWNGSAWVQKGKDIDGEAADDNSGYSVSMPDANTIAIGAMANDGNGNLAGHVRVYFWNGSSWIQKGSDIDGEATNDFSGGSVSMPDANTVAIGAIQNDGSATDAGHVRVYTWSGSAWIQKGSDIDGEAAGDNSGYSVSMPDANTIAIGAIYNSGSTTKAGHTRVYSWNGSAWVQKGVDIDGEAANDWSGWSVSMPDANTVAIGAISNSGKALYAGHARVYSWNGSAWAQKGVDLDGEASLDVSGFVSMPDANTIAIGAYQNDGTAKDAGHARVYTWNGSAWVQKGLDIDGEAAGDHSSYQAVSMPDPNTIAIGAYQNGGKATDAGHARVYSFCKNTFGTISRTACYRYVSPSTKFTWTKSGTYYDTISNKSGCDSVITVNLTINPQTVANISRTACYRYVSPSTKYTWTKSGIYNDTIPNRKGCDSVITVNLIINPQTAVGISRTACFRYVSPSTKYTWTKSGTYYDTIPNKNGCDSVIIVNLIINTVDISVTNNSPTLIANSSTATYQWLDCNNGFKAISGANKQSFTALSNGSYAVEITQNGCVDTSVCAIVGNVGIVENNFGDALKFFPNPTQGDLSIELGDIYYNVAVKIQNGLGQEMMVKTQQEARNIQLNIPGETGIYFVEITSQDKKAVLRVLKN